jgi:hypothetical protein
MHIAFVLTTCCVDTGLIMYHYCVEHCPLPEVYLI